MTTPLRDTTHDDPTTTPKGETFYTPHEAAKTLKITRALCYRLMREGRLAAIRAGKHWRVCSPITINPITEPIESPRKRARRSAR